MWKQRLAAHINGTSTEKLDPAVIQQDDQCALGKWIYGEGKAYTDLSMYEKVRQDHAHFHEHAAAIVKLVDERNHDIANQLLHGDYSKISERLKHEIVTLNSEVQANSRS